MLTAKEEFVVDKYMRSACELIKILPTDTEKDIMGKIFTRFKQEARIVLAGYELGASFGRLKNIIGKATWAMSGEGYTELYVAKALRKYTKKAFKEHNSRGYKSLNNSLLMMKILNKEATDVINKSEAVIKRLAEIEKEMNNE